MGLAEQFGRIDIYLFDQLLRGNIAPGMRVVDAGCGSGRNLVYLLREGYEVFGVDSDPEAVAEVRGTSRRCAPALPQANFQVAAVEQMPFADAFADVVLCNSVLHFARTDAQFEAMINELWRVLKPGGLLFCRLGSAIGTEPGMRLTPVGEGRSQRLFWMGDGQVWYLVDAAILLGITRLLGGELVDPLKTTVVQGVRCMTTWVVRK